MPANSITIIGNLTRDPELRFTSAGQANVTVGVAVNRRWQSGGSQEWQEATSYFDVVCWREQAENVAQSLQRGSRVIVTGRLEQRSWDGPEGEKRTKIEIIADEIGPSLRYANAQVTRNERREGGDGGSYQGGGGGYSRGGQGGGGGQGGYQQGGYQNGGGAPAQPQPAAAGGYDYSDEEPF